MSDLGEFVAGVYNAHSEYLERIKNVKSRLRQMGWTDELIIKMCDDQTLKLPVALLDKIASLESVLKAAEKVSWNGGQYADLLNTIAAHRKKWPQP